MEILDFTRSQSLNNISAKKLQEKLSSIPVQYKNIISIAYNRYYESNIPVEYWDLNMEKDFIGDPNLKNIYDNYISDIKDSYISGNSMCLAGSTGLGKTLTICNILKKAVLKGYLCLYTTLSDIVCVITQTSNEDKFLARQELIKVDFLAIDEVDPRFIANDHAADLFARTLENIFRTRAQNSMPIIMATNSPNVIESFNGSLKTSLESLMKGYIKTIPVFGKDARKS